MKRSFGLVAALVSFMVACGPQTNEQDSELKWGHLPTSAGSGNWLTNVGPQDEIELCGTDTSYLEVAVRRWAEPLGRAQHLKIVACGKGTKVKSKITFATNHTEYPCTVNGVQGATDPNSGQMWICSKLSAPIKYVIVHETGHMWGMCDMYAGGESKCDSKNKTVVDNSAIMGNGSVGDDPALTKDDIEGIKAMGARSEFSAVNQAWADFLATNPTPGTGDSSGQVPGQAPANGADIFISLGEPDASGQGKIGIATALSANVFNVAICKGDKISCSAAGAQWLSIDFMRTNLSSSTRAFFQSTQKWNQELLTGQVTLFALDGNNAILNSSTVMIGAK